jgi:hypothetical protein
MSIKTVVWKPVEYEGMEYLALDMSENGVYAHSVALGVESGAAFRVDYAVTCGKDYATLEVNLSNGIYAPFHRALRLTSDGQGNWFDQMQKPLPELEGCIDVDITATPFTNTLPIKRIDWKVGQSEMFRMAWISVPELTVTPNRQRYTCLEKTADGAKFRFESPDINFEAVITVDADGLVVDYPGLFKRVV